MLRKKRLKMNLVVQFKFIEYFYISIEMKITLSNSKGMISVFMYLSMYLLLFGKKKLL